MAHYAFLDENNVVVDVIVGRDENEIVDGITDWEAYYGQLRGLRCLRTSYTSRGGKKVHHETNDVISNKHFRFNFAGTGYTYDDELDAFIPPKPFYSWVLDKTTCTWKSPIAEPKDGKAYAWNENLIKWVELPVE